MRKYMMLRDPFVFGRKIVIVEKQEGAFSWVRKFVANSNRWTLAQKIETFTLTDVTANDADLVRAADKIEVIRYEHMR